MPRTSMKVQAFEIEATHSVFNEATDSTAVSVPCACGIEIALADPG